MYEGKPPQHDGETSLQSVSWADLSSRLAAARDLRKALAKGEGGDGGEGSFDAVSARWLADHAVNADGEPVVNPDDLGNLKAVDPMAGFERAVPMPPERMGERMGGRGKA
jgi:hypothetical protein